MYNHVGIKNTTLFYVGCLAFMFCIIAALIFQTSIILAIPIVILLTPVVVKDIRKLFYVLLFCIPFSINLKNFSLMSIDFPDEPIMLILTIVFLFFLVINASKNQLKERFQHPLLYFFIISFIWSFITALHSNDVPLSLKYVASKVWYLIPFLFFPIHFLHHKKVLRIVFISMLVPLVITVIQVVNNMNTTQFSFERIHEAMWPFYYNHVLFGGVVSTFLPLLVGAIFLTPQWNVRKWILILLSALFLFAIYFSYSRAAWVAVIFAAICYVCVRLNCMHWFLIGFYALVLVFILWLGHENKFLEYRPKLEKTFMHDKLIDHIMATIQGHDISSAERYYRWIAAIKMSADKPLMGVGPNQFYVYYKNYVVQSYRTWVSRNLDESTTHNYFLYMLVEQGYPAMLLYASFMVYVFWYAQKVRRRINDPYYKKVIMSILCMLAAFFINNFFSEILENDKMGSIFLVGIATIIAIDIHHKKENNLKKMSNLFS